MSDSADPFKAIKSDQLNESLKLLQEQIRTQKVNSLEESIMFLGHLHKPSAGLNLKNLKNKLKTKLEKKMRFNRSPG